MCHARRLIRRAPRRVHLAETRLAARHVRGARNGGSLVARRLRPLTLCRTRQLVAPRQIHLRPGSGRRAEARRRSFVAERTIALARIARSGERPLAVLRTNRRVCTSTLQPKPTAHVRRPLPLSVRAARENCETILAGTHLHLADSHFFPAVKRRTTDLLALTLVRLPPNALNGAAARASAAVSVGTVSRHQRSSRARPSVLLGTHQRFYSGSRTPDLPQLYTGSSQTPSPQYRSIEPV